MSFMVITCHVPWKWADMENLRMLTTDVFGHRDSSRTVVLKGEFERMVIEIALGHKDFNLELVETEDRLPFLLPL